MRTLVLVLCLLAVGAPFGSASDDARVLLSSPALGCPGIEGRFVAVLAADGQTLVVASTAFPGSRSHHQVNGGSLTMSSSLARVWELEAIGVTGGRGEVWQAVYPTVARNVAGCVAFDAARFSSEGDLASYLRWLISEVYLKIPAEHRPAAFRLGERDLELTVRQEGYKPMVVTGREGATLAFRLGGVDGLVLLRAYALDEAGSSFAGFVATASSPFWRAEQQAQAQFYVMAPESPVTFADASLSLGLSQP